MGELLTLNAEGIDNPTDVTVPTDQLLFALRFCDTPLIERVRVVGTGVYPSTPVMSRAVIGAADVTNPFPFTANLRNVLDP
jgi:hypothetical protein